MHITKNCPETPSYIQSYCNHYLQWHRGSGMVPVVLVIFLTVYGGLSSPARGQKPGKLVQTGLVPVDCSDIHKVWPRGPSGVYRIYPAGGQGHTVFCDMTLDGGGWTIFQRRINGSENFNRKWVEYQRGFGNVKGEHWLGNQALHEITVHGLYELRINLEDFEGNTRFAKYNYFRIGNEAEGYQLSFSGYVGNAGDSLAYSRGAKFSTPDHDQDTYRFNCAKDWKGAWWFKSCHKSHLNGVYYQRPTGAPQAQGIVWSGWRGFDYRLKSTTMMLRRHHMAKFR